MKRFFTAALALTLCMGMLMGITACGASMKATDLLSLVSPNKVEGKTSEDRFVLAYTEFSKRLYAGSAKADENVLISPLSVMLALSMTANGANGTTLAEMESVLGSGIPFSEINEYLCAYVNGLYSADDCKLSIANSIWFREGLNVKNPFLQNCADYYTAQLYREPFDNSTVNKINLWVKDNTDKMIDKIIDRIDAESMMYLINAMAFDAEWATKFEDTRKGVFTNSKGESEDATYLRDVRGSGYFELDGAKGIVLNYKGGRYGFAAILPDDRNADVNNYFALLDTADFIDAVKNAKSNSTMVELRLPQFKFDYETEMSELLAEMGMPTAFGNGADFSGISDVPLAISQVVHKTYIELDKDGTKAAAVTMVGIEATSAGPSNDPIRLYFDRPFIFAITDNETGMPLFIGTLVTTK